MPAVLAAFASLRAAAAIASADSSPCSHLLKPPSSPCFSSSSNIFSSSNYL
ncbi:hypothetical protein DAI22_01g375650 [Oryza sativa Japonica Group]|nr:hypothetical protein DAI22_01g375650 [Oryza sativa Japonica Group]